MWKTLYTSSFGFIHSNMGANAVCTIAIQKKMDADDGQPSKVIDLSFDNPLEIEWPEKSKEETVCGSTATIRMVCNNDREFVPLMTSEPGTVRLVVSASSVNVWCGMLDVRQCEEPYSSKIGYEVELTFSDFGILDRIVFDGNGIMDGVSLVNYVIAKCDLPFNSSQSVFNCSTKPYGEENDPSFSMFSFDSRNFYDEDGNGMSCKDVLDSILQPFMMKITQRNMRIYCYDLKWLYDQGTTSVVNWSSNDQVLSFDKYINKTKITFSTYCDAELTKEELDLSDCGVDFNDEHINLYDAEWRNSDNPFYSLFPNTTSDNIREGRNNVSYTIHVLHRENGVNYDFKGVSYYNGDYVQPFKIVPYNGGEEISGFAAHIVGNHLKYENGSVVAVTPFVFPFPTNYSDVVEDNGRTLFAMEDFYLPPLKGFDANKFKLKLKMNVLMDPRYNPFSDPEDNFNDVYDYCKKWHNHTFVKLLVQLRDREGNVLAHYSNAYYLYNRWKEQPHSYIDQIDSGGGVWGEKDRYTTDLLTSQGGWYDQDEWSALEIPSDLAPYCWLDFYDKSNIDESCGTLGWNCNRHNVGSLAKISSAMRTIDDGQYIPYPSQGGYIHVEVLHGLHRWHNSIPWWPNEFRDPFPDGNKGIRHVFYSLPAVTIVKAGVKMSDAEYDDIEVDGVVNYSGLDDLQLSTTSGSSDTIMPTAKGIVRISSTGYQLAKATRAGVTDTLENLMLGTIYSQFHGHKLKLTGEKEIDYALNKYRVRSEQGKVFFCTGEVMNVKEGTSNVNLVELFDEFYEKE